MKRSIPFFVLFLLFRMCHLSSYGTRNNTVTCVPILKTIPSDSVATETTSEMHVDSGNEEEKMKVLTLKIVERTISVTWKKTKAQFD